MLKSKKWATLAVAGVISQSGTALRAEEKKDDYSQEAAAAAAVIETLVRRGPDIYSGVIALFGRHPTVNWMRYETGPKFTVLKLENHKGSRTTLNFDNGPFAEANRAVRFRLVNVKPEHIDKVWWMVKSDVAGRGDGNRLVNGKDQPGHNSTVWVDRRAGKDFAYYLCGRWDRGVSEADFYAQNPDAAVIITLE